MGCHKLHIALSPSLRVIHRKKEAKPSKTTGSDYPFGLKHKGYNNIINGTHHPYGYNGKEENDELGLQWLDFGARNYNSALGRWMNVDPMADTYTSFSTYSYAMNNPVFFVDPDGERIGISAIYEKDKDGNDVLDKDGNRNLVGLDIKVTGKILNQSSTGFTKKQLSSFASRLNTSIKSSFESGSEKDFKVNVSTDITVATSDNPLSETDHAFTIVDDGKIPDSDNPGKFRPSGVVGFAAYGELGIYINSDVVNEVPAKTGSHAGSGRTSTGYGTLERTGAHEVGHSANQAHPTVGTMDGNLMHQTRRENAGTKLTKAQLLKIREDYNKGLLNRGRQFYTHKNRPIGPRKPDGSF